MDENAIKTMLQGKVKDAVPPPPMPIGLWRLRIIKFEFGESAKKKTPYVRFNFRAESPGPNVNPEHVAALTKPFNEIPLRDDFYLTPDAMFRLRKFIEDGLRLNIGERSFMEVLPETVNREVDGDIKHRKSDREGDDSLYSEISGYAPV